MVDLLRVSVNGDGAVSLAANIYAVAIALAVIAIIAFVIPWLRDAVYRQEYEVNEVEIGVGAGRVKIKPNHDDLQIAYRLWVELKTRKLGLPFEEDHDVIVDVYNSWYDFFRITRELIKSVPIAKIRGHKSTQELIGISIDVLNKAIRPHLTKWHARYRHWLELELRKQTSDVPPQELQKRFPNYGELVSELKATNTQLVAYARMLATILELSPDVTREGP